MSLLTNWLFFFFSKPNIDSYRQAVSSKLSCWKKFPKKQRGQSNKRLGCFYGFSMKIVYEILIFEVDKFLQKRLRLGQRRKRLVWTLQTGGRNWVWLGKLEKLSRTTCTVLHLINFMLFLLGASSNPDQIQIWQVYRHGNVKPRYYIIQTSYPAKTRLMQISLLD